MPHCEYLVCYYPLKYRDPSGHKACIEDPYSGCTFDPDWHPNGNVILKILTTIIAMESHSGEVPDYVNYQKAWALLNLRTAHRSAGKFYTPFVDWKMHERDMFDLYKIKCQDDLLARYNGYLIGRYEKLTPEEFAMIEKQTQAAISEWGKFGSNSNADPVHGATGFRDAPGLFYPTGTKGEPWLKEFPDYRKNIMTSYSKMENFRRFFSVTSIVYKVDIIPETGEPVYNFTEFHGPFISSEPAP